MIELSKRARAQYESWEPQFYRHKADAAELQTKYFEYLLPKPTTFSFLGEAEGGEGFAIATLTNPPTYDPGGPTALVDDFVVSNDSQWESLGKALLDEVTREAKARGAVGLIVVCVAKDAGKLRLFSENDLSRVCEWHQKRL